MSHGASMYYAFVVLLMLVCPAVWVLCASASSHHTVAMSILILKWFVFWAVGIRMFAAGVRQVLQPQFTATQIFGIRSGEPYAIVREVGFGNLAIGTLAIASLFRPEWIVPAAVAGGLYYGLAGLAHAFIRGKNAMQETAMISDAFAFMVLLIVVTTTLI